MKRKYQLYGFNYLTTNRDNETNIINGKKEPSENEFKIACFNGNAFFRINNKYYIAKYPKYNKLRKNHKEKIFNYCGYEPKAGEYGVILGALGIIIECDYKTYTLYEIEYLNSLTSSHG